MDRVTEPEILAALERGEAAIAKGESLGGTGFWRAVGHVKRSADLTDRFAERIAVIDREAFERWALVTIPVAPGTALMSTGVLAGVAGVGASYYLESPWDWLIFGFGTAGLLVFSHSLAHYLAGRAMGMQFTHWFIGTWSRPYPGVKVDYSTYLRTPARRRAWMHAAGALTTKIIPFALIPAAIAADLPEWVGWALVGFGILQIVTDALLSVRNSDWMKFRREMRYTRPTPS